MAYIYDNFNDNSLDTSKWEIITIGTASLLEQNQRIECSLSGVAGTNYKYLKSKHILSGDFDIQIDFSDLILPNVHYTTARGLTFEIDSNNKIDIQRQYGTITGQAYASEIKINGTSHYYNIASTDTSGKFRIVRINWTVTTYYWDNSWIQLAQRTDFPATDGYMKIGWIYTNAGATASVNYDNFIINSVIWGDDFNDNNLDTTKWTEIDEGTGTRSLNEQNQRLELSISGASSDSKIGLVSNSYLVGNFDIQVDYSNLVIPAENVGRIILLVVDEGASNAATIARNYRSDKQGHAYLTSVKLNGSYLDEEYVATSDTEGKLRIKRGNNTLYLYHWSGSNWILDRSETWNTTNVWIKIMLRSMGGQYPNLSCYIDNFIISKGQIESLYDISNDFRTSLVEPELYDINNDFRTLKISPIDIDNDFRFFGLGLYNFDNDFRMSGNIVKLDIDNDFRMGDITGTDIDNDFRMVGEVIRGDLNNDFRNKKEVLSYINNKFSTVKLELKYINNKVNSCIEVIKDISNIVSWVKEIISDVSNDFRTKKETRYEVNNDFRMWKEWQKIVEPWWGGPEAGPVGFQSLGKEYVKVYINSVEQADADINSISISQILNGPATATFNLGRPYDDTKPNTDSIVEIKYNNILLYKGYITEITPTNNPESIRINCQDEYWNLNKTKKYFFVGRKPADVKEYYYETINTALIDLGFSYGIGNFIPQTMNLYGSGISDAITNLVQDSGNFSWFISPDGTKKIWQAGTGSIINLEKQELEKNLGLYQVIRHSFRESIVGLINKLRVQMGNWTIRKTSGDISGGSGIITYNYSTLVRYEEYATPAWDTNDRSLNMPMKYSGTGWGYERQDPNKDYKDVFRKFWIPQFRTGWYIHGEHTESLIDKYPPLVEIWEGEYWGQTRKYIDEGFTLDYGYKPAMSYYIDNIGRPSITFSEPMVNYHMSGPNDAECHRLSVKKVKLHLWKLFTWSYTINPETDPDTPPVEDISNPLMFYTDKMGTYPETIIGVLSLSGLSKQDGFIAKNEEGEILDVVPTWDDTLFAKDYANWQLSKTCDKKIIGSMNLTIDAMIYYNIDLSKRIQISGVVSPINIKSITYNFNNFTTTLQLESGRYYRRSISIPYHGE